MESFDIHTPRSFDEAAELIVEHGAKPIAGGSAVMTLMKEGILQVESVVNLRALQDEYEYVRDAGDSVHVGALTRLRTLETHDIVADRLPVVEDCLSELASIRVRNAATIGGHLAHADPDLDLPPVLAGLDASIVVHGTDGERTVPFREFVRGFYDTDLEPGELVKEVRIPYPTDRDGVYYKHRSRSEADWPCVGVAAFLSREDGAVPEVFVNSVAETPILRLRDVDDAVDGELDDDAAERIGDLARDQCDPVADGRGTEFYKREMAKEFTIRAVRDIAGLRPTIPAEGGA